MILSVSRRTDIPCLYGEWFINRLREGYVLVRNPFNHSQISRITVSPDTVDCVVFWSKDPGGILPYLDEIDGMSYRYMFQFTVTPYGPDIERNLRPKHEIIETFMQLSKKIGRSKIVWRYDPIIINDNMGIDYHKENFEIMCQKLTPYTEEVIISFVDVYKKSGSDMVGEIREDDIADLSAFIGRTATDYGITASACCERGDYSSFGIGRSSCIDRERIERICGYPLKLHKDKNQRPGCGCSESVDIGIYGTCVNGCVYCYANRSAASAMANYSLHDPLDPMLIPDLKAGELIRERKTESNKILL